MSKQRFRIFKTMLTGVDDQEVTRIRSERDRIKKMLINYKKDDGDPYKANPRGIRWNYHTVDSKGRIRRK